MYDTAREEYTPGRVASLLVFPILPHTRPRYLSPPPTPKVITQVVALEAVTVFWSRLRVRD